MTEQENEVELSPRTIHLLQMSHILRHFRFNDELDIIWTICSFFGLCILITTLFTLTLIVQHLYCIPKSDSHASIVPQHIATYSMLSAVFATFSVILSFAAYIVCTQWSCPQTVLGTTISILLWDTYIWAKLLLYLLFIGRLFNPYHLRIYQYSPCIKHLLWMLLIAMGMTMIVFNIYFGFYFTEFEIPSLEIICSAVYVVTDCILAISTMILFFRPICSRRYRNAVSPIVGMSVVKQYCIISVLQLISALSYQIVFVGWFSIEHTHMSVTVWFGYVEFYRVIQMLDCLLIMVCIHLGFVRQLTVCFVTFGT